MYMIIDVFITSYDYDACISGLYEAFEETQRHYVANRKITCESFLLQSLKRKYVNNVLHKYLKHLQES